MPKPILCLDFDGVIHSYGSGWKGATTILDPPVEGVGAYLLEAVCHFSVAILSSRSHQWGGRRAMRRYVRGILWDACLANTEALEKAWKATQGTPPEWIPWTAYDVRDAADHIHKAISYPLFKPPAAWTIDDRALTFDGNWHNPAFQPEGLRSFSPWYRNH
jgi:hypothetical protein